MEDVPAMSQPESATVKAGRRMMAVLDYIARADGEVGVSDISRDLDLAPSTAHRLLATLVAGGLVQQDSNRKYRLGVKLIALGHAAQERLDLRAEALEAMRELAHRTHTEVNLAQLDEGDVLYIEKVTDAAPFALTIRVGQRRPAYCRALGKVLLAHLPHDEVQKRVGTSLPRRTPQTITNFDALMAHLAGVRDRGYAVDREESETGWICLAAPVRDATGQVVAALSASGPASQMLAISEAEIARQVNAAADQISWRLGYRDAAEARSS
jgi:IclR family KDG regulon transcriptional repressor